MEHEPQLPARVDPIQRAQPKNKVIRRGSDPGARGDRIAADLLGEHPFDLLEVPRGSWLDRVTIEVRPADARRIALKPYPFDAGPLRVVVPVRIIDSAMRRSGAFHRWWHSQQTQWIQFEFCAA